jgi:hypothetical protein
MNLNVLRMTIQGLETQRAALAGFQAMQASLAAGAQATQEAPPKPDAATSLADEWWRLLQQVQGAPASPAAPPPEPKREKKPK